MAIELSRRFGKRGCCVVLIIDTVDGLHRTIVLWSKGLDPAGQEEVVWNAGLYPTHLDTGLWFRVSRR